MTRIARISQSVRVGIQPESAEPRSSRWAHGEQDSSHAGESPHRAGFRREIICWKTRTGPPGLTPLWARDQSVSWGAGEAVRFG
jgi:hypothetical protein